MPADIADLVLFLFVPADRPERFAKAAGAGADAIIVDLEDAVSPSAKADARSGLTVALGDAGTACPVFIRINGSGTSWHDDDVTMAACLPIHGVVLPKAESVRDIEAVRARLPAGMPVLAIIESAKGLVHADAIAAAADRLAFGSIDFAADLGCAHSREALLLARSRIVLASRIAGRPAPVDGVTLSIKDGSIAENEARYGASLGFAGKLLIHPAQITPARAGQAPAAEDVAWALRIAASIEDGARAVDGAMVDAPVLARARQIIHSYKRHSNGS
ncbi:CoA ester lyase [Mesorhizobium sp. YR577]|uniref:HpcH/HpaI aldolase/citrate lyase family protein n=1 Tax=Mesorhizobium sp. YR577 TaxID=1884373 RepID=UPI0008F2FF38|nr:CoA ester lyase [Mesorhizobium sp. YR577]SFU19555.1 citrate lyase subunit beta / citryl-CoA lyase [Mesorhizobium sp. YR577]